LSLWSTLLRASTLFPYTTLFRYSSWSDSIFAKSRRSVWVASRPGAGGGGLGGGGGAIDQVGRIFGPPPARGDAHAARPQQPPPRRGRCEPDHPAHRLRVVAAPARRRADRDDAVHAADERGVPDDGDAAHRSTEGDHAGVSLA